MVFLSIVGRFDLRVLILFELKNTQTLAKVQSPAKHRVEFSDLNYCN